MKWLEKISHVLIILAACGVPGAIEFGDWIAPTIMAVIGVALKIYTMNFYYEE